MDALALSPRRGVGSPTRTSTARSTPPSACVDVQWTFLPPHSMAAHVPPPHTPSSHRPTTGRLLDAIDHGPAREELHNEQLRQRHDQEHRQKREQRVLYDLMGETQRQAMLDKVMAEMEAMALTPIRRLGHKRRTPNGPVAASPPSSATRRSSAMPPLTQRQTEAELLPQRRLSALGFDNDRDDDGSNGSDEEDPAGDGGGGLDDDLPELRAIRERHRQRMEAAEQLAESESPRRVAQIIWQKSSYVRAATDLPAALSPRDESAEGSELFVIREDAQGGRRAKNRSSPSKKSRSPTRLEERSTSPTPALSPRSHRVRKAHYGAWYMPQKQWWPVHQSEQEALAELYPDEQPTSVERHECPEEPPFRRSKGRHRAPSMSPHAWPSLLRVPAPPSSLASRSPDSVPTTPRVSSPSPVTATDGRRHAVSPDAIAIRTTELQQEIPQVYIAREYRNYLQAKGARIPSYLNY